MADRVDVTCPCCRTRLTVDTGSGEVLSEDRPRQDASQTFDAAVEQVRAGSRKREDAFAKAFDRTRNMDTLLERKFEEARKKAEKTDGKPINPLDLD